jgi:hypothetical protein
MMVLSFVPSRARRRAGDDPGRGRGAPHRRRMEGTHRLLSTARESEPAGDIERMTN